MEVGCIDESISDSESEYENQEDVTGVIRKSVWPWLRALAAVSMEQQFFAQAIPDIESWPQENEARLVTRDGFEQHRGFFIEAKMENLNFVLNFVLNLCNRHTAALIMFQGALKTKSQDATFATLHQCSAQDKVARQSRFLEIADFLGIAVIYSHELPCVTEICGTLFS